jgi:hypothetical protein
VLRLAPKLADAREWEVSAATTASLVAGSAHRLHGSRSSESLEHLFHRYSSFHGGYLLQNQRKRPACETFVNRQALGCNEEANLNQELGCCKKASRMTTTKQAGARWKGVSAEERKELMKQASRAYWDAMTPEQRSEEMKRRAGKRKPKS